MSSLDTGYRGRELWREGLSSKFKEDKVSETPRTDEIVVEGHTQEDIYRLLIHARQLERELSAAQQALDERNCPRRYVQQGGLTRCLYGTSSISAYEWLEAKLAALTAPGEYAGLLDMIEHEARIWPNSPIERLLRATATAIEQLQARVRTAETMLNDAQERFLAENDALRIRAEQAEAEVNDARSLAFNLTTPRTVDDARDDVCEQIQLLHDRAEARLVECKEELHALALKRFWRTK